MKYYIGFDIGGSQVKAVLVGNKKIVRKERGDTPTNYEALLDLLKLLFKKLTDGITLERMAGVGVGIAGVLNKNREKIINCPNIKYLSQKSLKESLSDFFSLPIKLEHDVHCFLLAEKEVGLAKKMRNVFYLTLGTGIGGALMMDGKIYIGSHGAGGEAGHMIFDIFEESDLEEAASNKFIKKILGYDSIEAFKRAQAGDKQAQNAFIQLGKNLGVGLANIINLIDPEAIILAGGISEAKDLILPGIKEEMGKLIVSPEAQKTEIFFSELGNFGGAFGAALLFGGD